MRKNVLFIFAWALTLVACTGEVATPKPYGYYRLVIPDTAYVPFSQNENYADYPYDFALSQNAELQPYDELPFSINIFYPQLDATIHCTYYPVEDNLRKLIDEANDFVYRNASFANAIPDRPIVEPEKNIYGVVFGLEGNTASSCQFFVTDSTDNYFRAAVYCNCIPNADSLAPVINYLRTDVLKMIETFEWKK